MHAFVVTGGIKDRRHAYIAERQAQWKVSSFDVVRLETPEASIGIAAVRDFQHRLLLAPYNSPAKLGLIPDADRLTQEAQNALLKLLEEPPPHTYIVLETAILDVLLPTIISRCSVMDLGAATGQDISTLMECITTIEQISTLPIGKRIVLVDEIAKSREDAKRWVELAITASRQLMLARYGVKTAEKMLQSDQLRSGFSVMSSQFLRTLLTSRAQLAANVAPKLVLDTIFLSL